MNQPLRHRRRRLDGHRAPGLRFYDDAFSYTFALPAALAAGGTITLWQNILPDAAFEIVTIEAAATVALSTLWQSPVQLQILFNLLEGAGSKQFFSQDIPVGLVCGTAQFPHILPVPKRFRNNEAIGVRFTNNEAVAITSLYITLWGRKIFSPRRNEEIMAINDVPGARSWIGADGNSYWEDYYGYVLKVPTLTAAKPNAVVNQIIEPTSDFEAINLAFAMPAAGGTTGWSPIKAVPLLVQITDLTSDRNLFSAPLFLSTAFGQAGPTFTLPQPRVFQKSTSLSLTVTDLAAGTVNNAYFLLEGRKVFEGCP